jgi:DeoR/GlpR family transcriptional regulator of sugar metabolism
MEVRNVLRRAQKEVIARLAASLVEKGDTLILDAGSTTSALARHLDAGQDLHVITNNLKALDILSGKGQMQVTLLGGQLRAASHGTVGPLAELALRRISANRLFLGADGIVAGYGLCEASAEQAYLKECMIRQSAEVYVLADASKLGRAVQQHWTPLDRRWTLITDTSATEAQLKPFHELRHVTVMVAGQGAVALSA